jgi:citrate/tricarballylate utilization protein
MQLAKLVEEGARQLATCNACRYCEGYCAVFPAMERRLEFAAGDLNYLANLCHNCGECYYACQYAPPHEFGVDIPRVMAQIRVKTYAHYAWPAPLGRAFAANGLVSALVLAAVLAASLLLASLLLGDGRLFSAVPGGNFYALIPHNVMAASFGAVGLFVLLALLMGFLNFWRDVGESPAAFLKPVTLWQGLADALSMKNLHGAGDDCTFKGEEQRSPWRRWFHHATFYGFMLCFAATSVGTLYHYVLGWVAPYALNSLPVLMGTLGGIGLVVGPAGLYWLGRRRDAATADPEQRGMNTAFIVLLLLTSLSGLALLVLRDSAALGMLLVVHLGVVMALFVTLPYGKFVHGIYRAAALVKFALESKRPGHNVGGEA